MSKLRNTKNSLLSLIEGIKKINDDPKGFSNSFENKYPKNIPSTNDFVGKKLDSLKQRKNQKKENKKDIFNEILEVVEQFLSVDKKTKQSEISQSGSTVNSEKNNVKKKINRHAISASEKALASAKEIVIKRLSECLFVGDGICGTNRPITGDTINLRPEEFDLLDILTVDPASSLGQIVYEPKSTERNKQKVNRDLYTIFSGGTYDFISNNDNTLFTTTWDVNNQHYTFSGLTQGNVSGIKVQDFISDYYSSIEFPEINDIIKTGMLLTIQGGQNSGKTIQFDKSLNLVDRLLKKLLSVCGSDTKKDELKNQNAVDMFDENEEDIESYFDFDDVEGIDLDDENLRYRGVLKFKDCYNFEIDVDDTHMEDFVYLVKNKQAKKVIDDVLTKVATDANEQSNNSLKIPDLFSNLINNFILNLPKALIMSVLSAKMFLPLIILYKYFKMMSLNVILNVKDLIKKFNKAIFNIVKDLFWLFINEFWRLIKIDLIAFVTKLVKKIIKEKYKRYVLIVSSLINLLKSVQQTNVDNCFSIFELILKTINGAINMKGPISIPSVLLFTADLSSGYSKERAFLSIVEKMSSLGVNTGPIYGEDNQLLTIVKSIIDGHIEEEDTNSFVKIVLKGGYLPGPLGGAVIPPGVITGVGKKI
jgi:hypothetical protein